MRAHYTFPRSYASRLAETTRRAGTYAWNLEIDEYLPSSRIRSRGRELLMLGGYSYLGLIRDKRIAAGAEYALHRFGFGSHGARPNCGTTSIHLELERAISATNRTADSIIYPSGFQANFSTISALVGDEDIILGDALNHASIIDGCKLSGARFVTYKHNDVDDLRAKLTEARSYKNRLVIADAVFSMDGDIAPVPALCQLCDDYKAILMIDEAHSLGVLGKSGFGITEHFDLAAGDIDVITGVLSKAIPSTGGYASGSESMVDYLKHNARSYLFSGANSPYAMAIALEAFKLLSQHQVGVEALWQNTTLFHEELSSARVNIGATATPITPIMMGDARKCLSAANAAFESGVYLTPIPFPIVPLGRSRLRATVTAEHAAADLIDAARILVGLWTHRVGARALAS